MRHANRTLGSLVLAVLGALLVYIAAYAVMLQPTDYDILYEVASYRWKAPQVRAFFRPIHQVDRKLRPDRWPTIPVFRYPGDN
jgi:hypothetical protein